MAAAISSSSTLTQEGLGDQLREALVRRMTQIVTIARDSMQTGNPKGVIYPQDVPSTFPQYDALRQAGYLHTGCAPTSFFERALDSSGNVRQMHFIAKKDVAPSLAIEAAIQGPFIAECGVTCQVARYAALMDVLGEDKFNKLFSHQHRINLGFLEDTDDQPMRYFVGFTKAAIENAEGEPGNRPLKVGHLALFKGVAEYVDKHPLGIGQAFNVICIDNTPGAQKFAGLGLSPEGVNESEIEAQLLDDYNKDAEAPFAICSDRQQAVLRGVFPNLASMKTAKATSVLGYSATSPQGFKIPVILDLMRKDVKHIKMSDVIRHKLNERSLHINSTWT